MKEPPSFSKEEAIFALIKIAEDLRDPTGGCPWDQEQTHESLRKNLIEEAYELDEAIAELKSEKEGAIKNFCEELGDVLFQVVMHCQLAKEKNWFSFNDVAQNMAQKLIARHPHVYGGETKFENSEKVLQNWERQKLKQKESVLDGIPKNLPALYRAYFQGEKAGRLNFDWPKSAEGVLGVREKIREELKELESELPENPGEISFLSDEKIDKIYEEFGDVFFALVQYARLYGIDPEKALRLSCDKFEKRFRAMEALVSDRLKKGEVLTLEEWSELYYSVKKQSSI